MSLIRWEPFRELDNFFRHNLSGLNRNLRGDMEQWAPTANISETEQEYLIKAELPEVKKEDVKVTLENGVLTISGERKHEKERKDENEIRVESFYGSFARSFYLPDNVDASGVKAESKDGVLRIHVPKTTPAKSTAINIKVS